MSVEIRLSNRSKGKSLFAVSKIPQGTIIFDEDPFVSCQFSWNAAYNYKACDHCLRPLETAEENVRRLTGNQTLDLPYPECCEIKKELIATCVACGVEYCSEDCRLLSLEQYHKVTCLQTHERNNVHPLEQLEEAWKHIHYPPETSSIMLIVRLLARIVQAPNQEEAIQTTLGFCHRSTNEDEELAHKFLGEKFAGQINLLRELLSNAFPQENVQQFITPEGFHSLLALIGTNGQGVGSSPFSTWRKNVEKLDLSLEKRKEIDGFIDMMYDEMYEKNGDFLNSEGIALYLKQSCANHSCDPNAEINFFHSNFRLSLVALKDIEPDEEICISYLGECGNNRSRHSRRKILMENYLFGCECSKCLDQIDDPDMTSEEEMSAEEEDE